MTRGRAHCSEGPIRWLGGLPQLKTGTLSPTHIPEASHLLRRTQVASKENLYTVKEKKILLVSLLNLVNTKFIDFAIHFWVASFPSFPTDRGDMTFP